MLSEAEEIAERIAAVQQAIATAARAAGRDAAEVQLLAVSKKQPISRIQAAYDAGLRDFGENYMQGLEQNASHFGDEVRWHFIGHIQSKKARRLAWVHLIHSVDSAKVAKILSQAGEAEEREVAFLINVNISREASKSGVLPEGLAPLLEELSELSHIDVQGLMCIPSPEEEPRPAFARLRELRDEVQKSSDYQLRELSMGMSSSFSEAIAEGATIVRVGTRIFGSRPS